ncbi:FecR domain-containing protein [Cupriavidus pauculus]|uniref:Histidine kinase n=1 Tax=Cupriavidus pauculus TaxID=82633 RepID=A0A2N5CAM0_9BURK|nr:FecR domain-containing protein [Cupriavidus pauculus]PLP99278.1 histidine kinase [Cupriavidus pauculus]
MRRRRWLGRAALCGGMACLILPGSTSWAGPAGSQGGDFIYEVEPGDTLIGLAARYMQSPDDWRLLQTRNRVADPYRLVPGSHIRMPLSRIPVAPATARVVFARGQVRADGRPVQVGQALAESSHVDTGADGAVTLELPDGTRVALPADTSMAVRRMRSFARSGLTDTVIGIDRGAADSRVAPKGGGVGRYEIRTPVMVTGVRGTRYRVAVDHAGSRSEVVEGRVGVGARTTTQDVAAGFGVGVSAQGQLGKPVALLPAPEVAPVAQPVMSRSLGVQWRAVPGAARYRVGVARDAALTEWVSAAEMAEPAATLDDLPDGTLYVVVNALAADGMTGQSGVLPISVRRHPAAPFSLAPRPDGVAYGGDAQFLWASVPDATEYELAVAADAGFTRQADVRRQTGVESHVTLPAGQWWWRLRSLDARGQPGPWGDAQRLRVEPAPPLPAARDSGAELLVRWPADAAASAGYVVQVASDDGFAQGLRTLPAARNELALLRPDAGTYYVRVARAEGTDTPPAAAFSTPQRIVLPAVLRDMRGGVVVLGGADRGVETGVR